VISFDRVRKNYGIHEILSEVTLTADKGDILCISGSSGCGKSTILKIAAGIIRPDSGIVKRDSMRIGFAFQNDVLLPWKSAMENMVYILRGYYPVRESAERAEHWIEEFNLAASRHRKPREMSGGMRKRLSIAMAFSIEPEILILDEPFAFLDRNNISSVKQHIFEITKMQKTAVILATHKLENMDREGCRIIKIMGKPVIIR
jgi:ABC-type nitrate/sulfonate/bicarbonate transport system ATPase subunit